MVCKRIKTLVTGVAFAAMTAMAAPAFAAGDILDNVGQQGNAEAAPTAAQPRVVKHAKAHAAVHKAGKRHHAVKAKHAKVKKTKQRRHATAKHRASKARG